VSGRGKLGIGPDWKRVGTSILGNSVYFVPLDLHCLVSYIKYLNDRGVEQLVARRAHNPKVAGSSPVPATKQKCLTTVRHFCFVVQISDI
jgi:hypothetical protein